MKFRAECNSVRSLISKAETFFSNLVTESYAIPRTPWKLINTILHQNSSNIFPVSRCILSCQHRLLRRQNWTRPHQIFTSWFSWSVSFSICPASEADQFYIPATATEIFKFTSASESKQFSFDSIPILFLKLCFNELGPILTNLVNLSGGIFPSSFKQAFVQPLLKKSISIYWSTDPSLSTDDLNNFRTISNLYFISKILEKVVASHIQSHLSSNSWSFFQSAYRIFHSTETTLLKIHNDLTLAMDRGEVTCILLDLFAAFDTVDHSILFTRRHNWFGFDGLSLNWSSSYLSSRSQIVSVNDSISAFFTLSCGVPQSSVLGPLLYTLDTVSLGLMISRNSLIYTVSFVRWWYPAVHLFHFNEFCSISWNTYHHFHWHSLLDELKLTAPQPIKNWIPCYWHKTTTSQICWSYKLISQQWYHPSQFLCSQSWFHLWMWHVCLWLNELCI